MSCAHAVRRTVAAVLVAVLGCVLATPTILQAQAQEPDLAQLLMDLPGMAGATVDQGPSPSGGLTDVRIAAEDTLSLADLSTLVSTAKQRLAPSAAGVATMRATVFIGDFRVPLDFSARGRSAAEIRATQLGHWLHADGRASSGVPQGAQDYAVSAPAESVGQLAVDLKDRFDPLLGQGADHPSVFLTTPDRLTRYEVSRYVSREALVHLQSLQQSWPATRVQMGIKTLVAFSPESISLDQLLAGIPGVNPSLFAPLPWLQGRYEPLLLGWGKAYADASDFASFFGSPGGRAQAEAANRLNGVTSIGPDSDGLDAKFLEVSAASSGAWREAVAAMDALRTAAIIEQRPAVSFTLGDRPVGSDPRHHTVLTAQPLDPPSTLRAYATLAALTGVMSAVIPALTRDSALDISDRIPRRQLTKAFGALAQLPGRRVFWIETVDIATRMGDHHTLGSLRPGGGFKPSTDPKATLDPALVKRVAKIWRQVHAGSR